MIDSDLAVLYKILTRNLNRAVSRNRDRFPEDFMFRLTPEETEYLRFQFGTSNEGRGGRRYLPHVFTGHGVAMLSSVLNSSRAVQMNILIIRTFVRMRELSSIAILADEIDELKRLPPLPPRRRIGFTGTSDHLPLTDLGSGALAWR